jgi:predicted signal transduction protein with EAL and GGDEF domain
MGDLVLQGVAERLQLNLRANDLIARLGGDEFAVLVRVNDYREECAGLAGKILDALSSPIALGEHSTVPRVSIGIAMGPDDGSTVDAILKSADLALYQAKSEGRNTFRFFTPDLDHRHQRRSEQQGELRRALANGEFELYYQPIISLQRNEISGIEALLRWNHPKLGQLAPCEFMRCAEETGLILPISEWVLRQACQEAVSWPSPVPVAVNLSIKQLIGTDLIAKIVMALAATGLPAHRLELEITEPLMAQGFDAPARLLSRIRGLGVKVTLDDFATGVSSLNSLLAFPFDRIKIGQDFVATMNANQRHSLLLLQTIAGLGQALGITTTIEGIDSEERFKALRPIGFNEMQGYLLCPPRSASEIRKHMRADGDESHSSWWRPRLAAG